MNFKVLVFISAAIAFAHDLRAQGGSDPVIENIVEMAAEYADAEYDYSELMERLYFLKKHPLDVNKVRAEQLQDLLFLSPLQVERLLSYRKRNGPLLELTELQVIDNFDMETIRMLLPFVYIPDDNPFSHITANELLKKGSGYFMLTCGQVLQQQKGYQRSAGDSVSFYSGSPAHILGRCRYTYGKVLALSLNMEKDAGEAFFSGAQRKGFDFYSGSLQLQGNGLPARVLAGDYSLQFGQGLAMWSGQGFGKGSLITSVAKNGTGLRPYTSMNETLFLRGFAATLEFKKIELTPFISLRKPDAAVNVSDETGEEERGGLIESGLHRTPREISTKNGFHELTYGANLQYNASLLKLGLTAYHADFGRKMTPPDQPYRLYDFTAKQLTDLSLYYNYTLRNCYFFGEAAGTAGEGLAFVNGVLASLSPQLSLVLMHRYYQEDFYSVFNQAVAEGGNAANERGFYTGIVISPGKKTEISAYADVFSFPWLKYRADAPSSGYELLSRFAWSPVKTTRLSLRYKMENKQENCSEPAFIHILQAVRKQNFRFEIDYMVNRTVRLRNRAEVVSYNKQDEKKEYGYLMYQDVIYKPGRSRFSGNLRIGIFDTGGFNSRIYAFENDVLYGYSSPAYQDKGIRFYLNGHYKLARGADLWLRYSLTNYVNKEEIGSGPDLIDGNKKSDVKLQLRVSF